MPPSAARRSWPLLVLLSLGARPASSCSTFMLAREDCLVVAHNLDQEFTTPGMIHVHRRAERKRSVGLFDLQASEVRTPVVEWTSQYGSVTFGMLGRNLPDGGMNEAGLTVSEMALGESAFPFDPSRPALLGHLWIQYQLDNHASVAEVLDHLQDFNIEPGSTFTPPASANYHFFVTDRDRHVAIIEFLEDGPRVYRDGSAPVPVLCNAPYAGELQELARRRGAADRLRRILGRREDSRFATGARAVADYDPDEDGDPVGYAFATLHAMQFERTKRWSVVYDVRNGRVCFETARGGKRGCFDLRDLDFGPEARPLVLADLHLDRGGDVSGRFVPHSRERDRAVLSRFLRSLVGFVAGTDEPAAMDRHLAERYGMSVERYVDRALAATDLILAVGAAPAEEAGFIPAINQNLHNPEKEAIRWP